MGRRIDPASICKAAAYIIAVPFVSSIAGFFVCMTGKAELVLPVVPLVAVLIYAALYRRINVRFAAMCNGVACLFLLICFTVMMIIAKGAVEGVVMGYFTWLLVPFAPVSLMLMLMGEKLVLYATAFILYAAVFLFLAYRSNLRLRRGYIPLGIIILCIGTSAYLYMNRPAVKYAGHGFKYMHGFSSTDFTDYTVYSENSRLVMLDHQPDLFIENEEDMPVLDGAEACYPLYAAFAKACYKDIDVIEKEWLKSGENQYLNGKIVTFTNTLRAFDRLIYWGNDTEKYDDAVDMIFGARPSADQLEEAKYLGVEVDITPIGREAFVFFVEKDNPVDNLTSEQLRAIYHGDIANWKEVGGENQAIRAFQRPRNSGSQTMMEYFMGDISMKSPDTYEIVDAMTGVIEEVAQYANEAGAIGYSFRYFLEGLNQEKNVKILSVDGVYPTMENIESGEYPQTGNVCLITRKDETNPYVQKMKEFILSEDGQYIIRQTGYAGLEQKNE